MLEKSLFNKFIKLVKKYKLIDSGDNILVSLSGGPDSVFLLNILNKLKKKYNIYISALHINYNLRGKDSLLDEKFCVQLCNKLGIDLIIKKVSVKQSQIQTQARNKRIQIYRDLKNHLCFNKVALAHNLDDKSETLLFRLFRGTGISGLKSIEPLTVFFNEITLIRPMLDIPKSDIIDYLKSNKIKFRVDKSNLKNDYTRNKIRNKLIPIITDIFSKKNFYESVNTIYKEAEDSESIIDYIFNIQNINKLLIKDSFDLKNILFLNTPLKRIFIKKYLEYRNIPVSRKKIDLIINILNSGHGTVNIFKDDTIEISGNIVYFKKFSVLKSQNKIKKQKLGLGKTYSLSNNSKIIISNKMKISKFPGKTKNKNIVYIDADKISGSMYLGSKKDGDKFCPFGLKGREKTLKKFFIDEKICKDTRNTVPVISDKKKIIWLAGLRLDERFKIDQTTKTIIKIEYIQS